MPLVGLYCADGLGGQPASAAHVRAFWRRKQRWCRSILRNAMFDRRLRGALAVATRWKAGLPALSSSVMAATGAAELILALTLAAWLTRRGLVLTHRALAAAKAVAADPWSRTRVPSWPVALPQCQTCRRTPRSVTTSPGLRKAYLGFAFILRFGTHSRPPDCRAAPTAVRAAGSSRILQA